MLFLCSARPPLAARRKRRENDLANESALPCHTSMGHVIKTDRQTESSTWRGREHAAFIPVPVNGRSLAVIGVIQMILPVTRSVPL